MLQLLLVCSAITCLTWYLQFWWSRRHLYKLSRNIPELPGWPFIGNVFQFATNHDHFLKVLSDLTLTYPDIVKVWFGKDLVFVVHNPEYFKIIMNHPDALGKPDFFYKFLIPPLGYGLITAPVPKWKLHRRLVRSSFIQSNLDILMDVFNERSHSFAESLDKFCGQGNFDVCDEFGRCTLDASLEGLIGAEAKDVPRNYPQLLRRCSEIIALRMTNIWYQLDCLFNLTKLAKENDELIDLLHLYAKHIFARKIEEEKMKKERGDVSRTVLIERLLDTDLTNGELLEECITFIVTSSDTTTLAGSFFLVMLGMHASIQDMVLNEILTVVGPSRTVTAEDLPKLQYTDRVIKETLRLFPGFAAIARALDGDIDLKDGRVLPKGSAVVVAVNNIHRTERYWPDPLKFDPDRFLPEEVAKRDPYCYVPFSGGPRKCVGYRFGLMLLKTMAVHVLRKYKVSTKYKSVVEIQLKFEVTIGAKDGCAISLEKR